VEAEQGEFVMIIDSQVHAYAPNTPERPWRTQPQGWPPSATGEEMVAAMGEVGVDGAIFVSAFSLYGYDASYAMEVQRAHPGRFALVKPVNPDDPAVEEIIADWKKVPGAVAVRVMIAAYGANDPHAAGIPRILRAAARHDLPVNLQCGGNLDVAASLIDSHPRTRFVIDHLGVFQPRSRAVPPDVWKDLPRIVELARRPNVVIKVSGACTMSREPFPYPDIWDPLARVFDAWGFERCLWGTDWTRTFPLVNYEQAVEPFRLTDRLSDSEREMLMGGACAKAYGWSPVK
jgi:predicted TIM-barrel fold metal-dependent hydrolase